MIKKANLKYLLVLSALVSTQGLASNPLHDSNNNPPQFRTVNFVNFVQPNAIKPMARKALEDRAPEFSEDGKRLREERKNPDDRDLKFHAGSSESLDMEDLVESDDDAEEELRKPTVRFVPSPELVCHGKSKREAEQPLVRLDETKRQLTQGGLNAIDIHLGIARLRANDDSSWAHHFLERINDYATAETILTTIDSIHAVHPIETFEEYKAFCTALESIPRTQLVEVTNSYVSIARQRLCWEAHCHLPMISALIAIDEDRFPYVSQVLCKMLREEDYEGFAGHLHGIVHHLNRLPLDTIKKLPIAIEVIARGLYFHSLKYSAREPFFQNTNHFSWLQLAIAKASEMVMISLKARKENTDQANLPMDSDPDLKSEDREDHAYTPGNDLLELLDKISSISLWDQ